MPLDGHSYLVAQGWGGKGTGLRDGAISRPIAIPQKKNLAGLGKDRDEAFPFWDHLFTAAAKSIKVHCSSDEEGESDGESSSNGVSIKRTSTGIFSTRRPAVGVSADSGASTPSEEGSDAISRLSLLAQAKRDAAKRGLYSRFFRGPVLGPAEIAKEEQRLAALVSKAFSDENATVKSVSIKEHIEVQTTEERVVIDLEVSKSNKKKRKQKDLGDESNGDEPRLDADEKERKRRRKEEKKKRKEEGKDVVSSSARKERKEKKRPKDEDSISAETREGSEEAQSSITISSRTESQSTLDEEKALRKQRKEEKRRLKEKRKSKSGTKEEEALPTSSSSSPEDKKAANPPPIDNQTINDLPTGPSEEKKKKKKRKRGVDD